MFDQKIYKSIYHMIISVIIINFSLLMFSMQEDYSADLFQLQSALNYLENNSNIRSNVLIGEFLVGKKFKDIFTEEQLESVTPKINGDDLVLLKFDRNKKIYQLKPLQQYGITCGAHAFKNCLWMINGLKGTFNTFIESYLKTLDGIAFEKYLGSISCDKSTFFHFQPQKENIKEDKISCSSNSECLPEDSLKYLDQIFCFTYAPKPNPKFPGHRGNQWSKFFKFAEEQLNKIEPGAPIEEVAMSATIFSGSFLNEEIIKFYNVVIKDNFNLGLVLYVDNGSMGHATCLTAHKVKNNIEYLFLDSMNMPFDGKYPYMPLIKMVKSFIENPEMFKESLIRRAYLNTLMYVEQAPLAVFQIHLDIFIEDQFQNLNLKEIPLYQIYKPHFCELIKKYMQEDLENGSEYENILQKM